MTDNFEYWKKHHMMFLDDLYTIALYESKKRGVSFFENITEDDFFHFCYKNSSKYMSPYLQDGRRSDVRKYGSEYGSEGGYESSGSGGCLHIAKGIL